MMKNIVYIVAGFSFIIGLIPIYLDTNANIYFVSIYRLVLILCSLIACSYLFRKRERKLLNFLIPLFIALCLFFVGESLTLVDNLFSSEVAIKLLSISFILSYIPIYYLLISKIRKNQQYVTRNIMFSSLLLTILICALISPIIVSYSKKMFIEINNIDFVLTILYFFIEVAMFVVSIVLVILNRKLKIPYFLLIIVGSLFFVFIGDVTFVHYLSNSSYTFGSTPDIFYNISYLIFFVGLVAMITNEVEATSIFEIDKERKNYQLQYEEISVLVDDIVTVTSLLRHDLHNDIVVIQNSLELFLETDDKVFLEKLKQRIDIIIKRLEGIKTESDLLESVKEQPIDLNIIHGVANLFENVKVTSPQKNIQVKASKLLFPILVNLTQNSYQHGGDNIYVEIECEELDEHVIIRIKDNGIGIDDEDKERIFYRSYKKSKNKGISMGLYLARIAIERYGGSIFLEDNIPTGAIFVIKLQKC